jgi:TetR/AcrR family transcriptional regulator
VLREASISFNRRGYHGTSLEDVAQRLGVTKAALYYYFPNKQAVLKACFDHVIREGMDNVALARRANVNGREKVKIVLSNFLEHLVSEMSVSVAMMEEDALPPDDLAEVKAKRDEFEEALRGFLREGIEDGSIVSCDPKLAGFVLLGAVNWVPRWFKNDGQWSSKQMAQAVTEMLDRMLDSEPVNSLTVDVGSRQNAKRPAAVD